MNILKYLDSIACVLIGLIAGTILIGIVSLSRQHNTNTDIKTGDYVMTVDPDTHIVTTVVKISSSAYRGWGLMWTNGFNKPCAICRDVNGKLEVYPINYTEKGIQ